MSKIIIEKLYLIFFIWKSISFFLKKNIYVKLFFENIFFFCL